MVVNVVSETAATFHDRALPNGRPVLGVDQLSLLSMSLAKEKKKGSPYRRPRARVGAGNCFLAPDSR